MVKKWRFLLILFIAANEMLPAQKDEKLYREKLFIRVTTDNGIYKGRLYYVSDSNIRVIAGKRYNDLPVRIEVAGIQKISFKRKNALVKSMIGGFGEPVSYGAR
ncbi:MAG: hypothetical protein JWP81_3683 [Ferruginibacter sp.]|nr:hypothetical protein [Ferruginibacter sp.]